MRFVCSLGLLALLTSLAMAQEPAGPAAPAKPDVPLAQMTATLTVVNTPQQTITLARANDVVLFRVDTTTRVWIDDQAGKLEDLKPDLKVRVVYEKVDPAPYRVRQILDAATVLIRDAENQGVEATITGVAEQDGTTIVSVDTALGQHRDLAVSTEGRWQSRILKSGEPATAADFAKGEQVMISLRRARAGNWNLKGLADPPTFLAFLNERTLRGALREKSEDGRVWKLAVEGREGLSELLVTRATRFYQGGQAVEDNPFELGQEVLVKYATTADGQVQVKALVEPASWRAFGEAELARRQTEE